MASEYMTALELEELTGTPMSTWRYWASVGQGPLSFLLGRRRLWKRASVMAWLAQQELRTGVGDAVPAPTAWAARDADESKSVPVAKPVKPKGRR
jgi:hypothetical protein